MRHILLILLLSCVLPISLFAQHRVEGSVVDGENSGPLFGVLVKVEGTKLGAKSNAEGKFKLDLPRADAKLSLELNGYETYRISLNNLPADTTIFITLHLKLLKGSEVLVTAAPEQRLVRNEARQTEALPADEINEEMLMQPQGIGMMLREQNGIVQQTISATTQSSSLRIAGLPGRYTQYRVDGMPAGGPVDLGHFTSLLPPLNLRQIEVIRGMDAARFGPGGLSGVVNLFTKVPPSSPMFSFLGSVTERAGFDGVVYGGAPISDDISASLFASLGRQNIHDLNGDNYSDVPKLNSWKLAPSIEVKATPSLAIRVNGEGSHERTLGGYTSNPESAIGKAAPYVEETILDRTGGSTEIHWIPNANSVLTIDALGRRSERAGKYGARDFRTSETTLWGKGEYRIVGTGYGVTFGLEAERDSLRDETTRLQIAPEPGRTDAGYEHNHYDLYSLLNYDLSSLISVDAGLRGIKQNIFGNFLAASAAAVFHVAPSIDLRGAASIGPRFPTVFIEEVEAQGFQNFHNEIKDAEKALSTGGGINWHPRLEGAILGVTGSYYYTSIHNPTIAVEHQHSPDPAMREVHVRTSTGDLRINDAELSVQLAIDEIQFWGGFTYAVGTHFEEGVEVSETMLPKTKTNLAVSWDFEDIGLRVSAEHYIFGPMVLDNFPKKESPVFSLSGLLVQKTLGSVTLFVNAENIFDTRQPAPLILGDPRTGRIRSLPIYVPPEGRLLSAGVLLKLE